MGSEIPGLPVSAAGCEAPLEMLAARHHRGRNQCAALVRLRSHVAEVGADAAGASAAHFVVRYFDSAARDHHEVEERNLFPALLEAMAGSDSVCIRALTDSLADDHRELERLWGTVRRWLVAVEAGRAASPEAAEIDMFVSLYERHADREEQELLPMAARLLSATELDRIGQSMRA